MLFWALLLIAVMDNIYDVVQWRASFNYLNDLLQPKGKQGTRGAKQIVDENKSTLVFYRNILAAVNVSKSNCYWIQCLLFTLSAIYE
jgi:hypothetical protein